MVEEEMSIKQLIQEAKKRNKLRRVDLMLTEGDIKTLDLLADLEGASRSKVAREAIKFYLVKRAAEVKQEMEQLKADIKALDEAKLFLQKELKYAIRFQAGKPPFYCPVCDAKFDTKEKLSKHMKTAHLKG